HPSILISLNNLSRLEYNRGNYGFSEDLYDRVITATRASLGNHHPDLAIYLKNSADTHLAQGHYGAALAALGETLALEEQSLGVNLAGLGEQQRRDYLNTLNTTLDPLLTLHLQHLPQDATAATLALTAILQRKGRVLDAASLSLQRLRQNLTADDRQRFDRLNATRTQLANRINQGVGDQDPETYQSQIRTLENELERQEKELAQRSTAFQQTIQPITVEAVRQGLPQDAALIEFFRYTPIDATAAAGAQLPDARYAAYVLRPGGEGVGVDLGEAKAIDQRLQIFRRFPRDPSQPIAPIKALGQRLYQQLITPLLPYGGEASHWLISPDSQLNLLSFATLVDEQGDYLLQSRDITYLSSGRDLLRFDLSHFDLSHVDLPHRNAQESPARPQATAIIANPDYNLNADRSLAPSLEPDPVPSTRSAAMAATPWSPLPGTAEEAAVLQTLLPQAQVFSEAQATEFQVKTLASPQILHLATHGFFLPMDSDGGENPLLRSGLILAGANQRLGDPGSSGGEDGILTALEVSGLDLQNTEMVVLSACETGLGEVTDGEGVYGLRRAFTLTGAASQVMTLWSVPDRETL
ncbi:CHAT domain-containing protein, partial [Prochlorothrix hollandica]|uniref:CHAT domain-containing protein n=1 Tax=Prochlorothrix hollandica TaxID=1223 RepID=UPI003340EED5